MKKTMITIKVNNSLNPRQETLDNVTHTVFPVIMINQGVHNRILYTKEELSRNVQNWNNAPVSIGHPSIEGRPVSCNSPDIHNTQVVGKVFNAHMDNEDMKGELYLNNDKVARLLPDLYTFLENDGQMDVSTGLFCDDIYQSGDYQGEEYDSIAVNILSDHLAILPNQSGACSWADGCGIRANEKGGSMGVNDDEGFVKKKEEFLLPPDSDSFKTNEADYEQILGLVYRKLDAMDIRDEKYHYAVKIYQDRVIYRIRYRDGRTPVLMQRQYSLNEHEDAVEWTTDPVEVVRNETFTPKTNAENPKKKENKMAKVKTMKECCPDQVEQFIKDNEQFSGQEDVISGMTEDQFKILMKTQDKTENEEESTSSETTVTTNSEDGDDKGKQLSFDEIMEMADAETRESIEMGKTMLKQHRAKLIDSIKTNESNAFSDKQLESMSMDTLSNIAKLAVKEDATTPEPDQPFYMRQPVTHNVNNSEEVTPLGDPTIDPDQGKDE